MFSSERGRRGGERGGKGTRGEAKDDGKVVRNKHRRSIKDSCKTEDEGIAGPNGERQQVSWLRRRIRE